MAPATWHRNGDENEDLSLGGSRPERREIYPFGPAGASPLTVSGKRPGDGFGSFFLSMIFSENRIPLFGIML
jgi:hypothetical protein